MWRLLILPSFQTISILIRELLIHITALKDMHIFFFSFKPLFIPHVLLMEEAR